MKYLMFKVDETSDEPIKMITLAMETQLLKDIDYNTNYIYVRGLFERLVFIGNNYYLISTTRVNSFKRDDFTFIKGNTINMD